MICVVIEIENLDQIIYRRLNFDSIVYDFIDFNWFSSSHYTETNALSWGYFWKFNLIFFSRRYKPIYLSWKMCVPTQFLFIFYFCVEFSMLFLCANGRGAN